MVHLIWAPTGKNMSPISWPSIILEHQHRIFPVGENTLDLDNLLLCATCLKGQLPQMYQSDSYDIVLSSYKNKNKTAKESKEIYDGPQSSTHCNLRKHK